jgi:peptidoglycan/xylan/chitin deacetylase (PgdA/CDA1 family)
LKLEKYCRILKKHGATPSFSATGISVSRNPKLFTRLEREGVDLLIQGFKHMDYSEAELKKQKADVEAAVSVFREYGLSFAGFRAPYLNYSKETRKILKEFFAYNSGEKFLWDCALPINCRRNTCSFISVPYIKEGLLEVPVSLPSDVWLLHRMRVKSQDEISQIWTNALDCSYERGELFTLQLHPENIGKCDSALEGLLTAARGKSPPVWITTLGEVASWWSERGRCVLLRDEERITFTGSPRATLLARNLPVPASKPWYGGLNEVSERAFTVSVNPAVGVSGNSSKALRDFLLDEGFIVEESTRKKNYGLYFDIEEFAEKDKLPLLEKIESSGKPYVRLWRWPEKARSALSIAGDIDCVTLWDYVLRAFGR